MGFKVLHSSETFTSISELLAFPKDKWDTDIFIGKTKQNTHTQMFLCKFNMKDVLILDVNFSEEDTGERLMERE